MCILLERIASQDTTQRTDGRSVRTVAEAGWSGVKNGELLRRAADQFDVFLTADQNLQFQQNLSALPMSVAVLAARTNRIEDLKPLMPELLNYLPICRHFNANLFYESGASL